jgi:hypothetical protein
MAGRTISDLSDHSLGEAVRGLSDLPETRSGRPGKERAFPRYEFQAMATATIHPPPWDSRKQPLKCFVMTRDLSRGGISILHPDRISKGQRIDLCLANGNELKLEVQWIRQEPDGNFLMGCRFVQAGQAASG